MINAIPIQRQQRRYKSKAGAAPTVALTLVAAGYDPVGLVLLLTFDRPVNADAFVGAAITVFDGPTNHLKYYGGTADLAGATGVSISLVAQAGTVHGSSVILESGTATGIVAVNDGGTWPGTGGIGLPFSA